MEITRKNLHTLRDHLLALAKKHPELMEDILGIIKELDSIDM